MIEKLQAFKESLLQEGKSPNTINQYFHEVSQFQKWYKECFNKTLDMDMQAEDIQLFKDHLEEFEKKPRSINTFIYAIKAFCKWGMNQGYLSNDPAAGIKPLTIHVGEAVKWLNREEERKFMREVNKERNARNEAIVELMRQAALRRSEICELRKADVVYQERTGLIHIEKGYGGVSRDIPINMTLIHVLMKYEQQYCPSDYYFNSQVNDKLHISTINYIFNQYRERTGILHLTPDVLRHTCIKKLKENRVAAESIAYIAGHFTKAGIPNTRTQAIYTNPHINDLQEAVDTLIQ